MPSFFAKTIRLITGSAPTQPLLRRKPTQRDLIRLESKIGAQLFGPVAPGHRREFFCLDANTWIWYEQWADANGQPRELTTRYEVHPNGILKVQDGQPYVMVEGEELRRLALAVKLYNERTLREIYHRNPATGERLVGAAYSG